MQFGVHEWTIGVGVHKEIDHDPDAIDGVDLSVEVVVESPQEFPATDKGLEVGPDSKPEAISRGHLTRENRTVLIFEREPDRFEKSGV